jgi:NADPH:quinone reductase-like Zn-dependent oxidoreductase
MSRVVRFHQAGGPEVLQIDDIDVPAPKPNEIQLRVKALGINRAEVMYRTNQYVIEPKFPATLGYEAAGVVEAVGADVNGFSVGDKISVVPAFSFADYGMYGELVNVPAIAAVRHPDNLSFEEAAATWMAFVTAYGALIEIGSLRAGDAVLIRAASSSVGVAAIQIANMVGATPIALTRASGKAGALKKAGAAHVIATSEQDIAGEVLRLTGGAGARIAFDPAGGAEVPNILKALSVNGIFFQYGALETSDLQIPVMDLLGKHLTIRGYELFEITTDWERLRKAKEFVNRGLSSGHLRPAIAKTFRFAQIADAHRFMESNSQVGKVVVTV